MRTPELSIALLGPRGQVGWQLQRSLAVLGRVTVLDRQGGAGSGDLSNPDGLRQALRSVRPHVIVNAAAWTAVDKAESERAAADAVNHLACGVLAEEAARAHALLVHYSTDYVFPGTGERPWVETDATDPVNAYGQTKLDGEQAIARVGGAHLIFAQPPVQRRYSAPADTSFSSPAGGPFCDRRPSTRAPVSIEMLS